jgi:tRNA(fMet)-specific endonuclease VapC
MGVVIDSSIFIAAERGRFDWIAFHADLGEEPLYLTAITLAELLHGAARADSARRRTGRLEFIEDIEARFPLLPFARGAAAEYAQIWASLSVQGNLIGTHDMQIAAIARYENHRVATLNAGEFTRVPELIVLDAASFRMNDRQ